MLTTNTPTLVNRTPALFFFYTATVRKVWQPEPTNRSTVARCQRHADATESGQLRGTEDRPGRAQTAALQKCFLKNYACASKTRHATEWRVKYDDTRVVLKDDDTRVVLGLITVLCCMPPT